MVRKVIIASIFIVAVYVFMSFLEADTTLMRIEHYLPNGEVEEYFVEEVNIKEHETFDAVRITDVYGRDVEIHGTYKIVTLKEWDEIVSSEEVRRFVHEYKKIQNMGR